MDLICVLLEVTEHFPLKKKFVGALQKFLKVKPLQDYKQRKPTVHNELIKAIGKEDKDLPFFLRQF